MPVRVEAGIVATELDHGALVVLNEKTGKLHQYNPTAAVMWKAMIEHGGDLNAAARATADHYGVALQTVRDDLDGLVQRLSHEGLVRVEP